MSSTLATATRTSSSSTTLLENSPTFQKNHYSRGTLNDLPATDDKQLITFAILVAMCAFWVFGLVWAVIWLHRWTADPRNKASHPGWVGRAEASGHQQDLEFHGRWTETQRRQIIREGKRPVERQDAGQLQDLAGGGGRQMVGRQEAGKRVVGSYDMATQPPAPGKQYGGERASGKGHCQRCGMCNQAQKKEAMEMVPLAQRKSDDKNDDDMEIRPVLEV